MKLKYLLLTVLGLFTSILAYGQGEAGGYIESPFMASGTGTTSATCIIKPGRGVSNIRDLAYKLDSNITTATLGFFVPSNQAKVTSATAVSGTTLWLANSPTLINGSDYIIYENLAGGTLQLLRAKSITSTSVTTQDTITAALAVNDNLWIVPNANVQRRYAPNVITGTFAGVSIWMPSDVPEAVIIDGNTTSCSIYLSGNRGYSK